MCVAVLANLMAIMNELIPHPLFDLKSWQLGDVFTMSGRDMQQLGPDAMAQIEALGNAGMKAGLEWHLEHDLSHDCVRIWFTESNTQQSNMPESA